MKRLLVIAIGLFISLGNEACSRADRHDSNSVSASSSAHDDFESREQELVSNRNEALLGDADAAKRLADYFAIRTRDKKSEEYWWLVAAENGDIGSMRTTAKSLLKEGGNGCNRAIFWLERARKLSSRWDVETSDIEEELAIAKSNLHLCLTRNMGQERDVPN